MTISNTANSVTYTGNGVTTVFDFDFNIPEAGDAVVTIYDSTDESSTELDPSLYTITGLGSDAGGSVTYPLVGSPIAATKTITIRRLLALVQETDLANQAGFYPEAVTAALDYLMMVCQQQQTEIDNALAFPIGATTSVDDLITQILNGAANASAAAASAAAAQAAQAATAALLAGAFPVQTANIGNLQVTTAKLAANAVDPTKIATSIIPPGVNIINGYLTATVAANALTISLKTLAGGNPSATDPVYFVFRNATIDNGDYTVIAVTAATTLVISSGSTLGFSNATAGRLWIVAFNDSGTVRLGVINCRSGTNIYPLGGTLLASSTAEGGAGGADSAQVFYTGAAVAGKAYSVLGFATWETGLVTAGTWAAGPTRLQTMNANIPLPGKPVQEVVNFSGSVATGTTLIPADDTIPQITEGNEYLTQAVTPSSAANILEIEAQLQLASSANNQHMIAALFQDATASALAAAADGAADSGYEILMRIYHRMLAATTSSTTLRARAGGSAAGTTTLNGVGGSRRYGGVENSFLRVKEIMS